jgi:predicted Zn-dependent protease
VVEAFLGRFVQSNLAGQSVLNGHSTFSMGDFVQGRQVLRDDLDLVVDTTLPYEPATSPCSSEGVPAGRVALIEQGRLRTPTLSLKWAARAGLRPTPVPRGSPSVLLTSSRPMPSLEQALELLDPGLLVHAVIGVQTQNQRTGRYSLVAPQGQVVRGGKCGGKVHTRLAGSFFDDLSDTSTVLVRFPHQRNPGLMLRCRVSGERA